MSHLDVRAGIAIEHRGRRAQLFPVATPSAFVGVVRVAGSLVLELEQSAQVLAGEVALGIQCLVDDARGERLFVRLALQNLLLDGPRRNEAVDKARLLLSITPHALSLIHI